MSPSRFTIPPSPSEWFRRARLWFRRDAALRELEEEMRFHQAERTHQLIGRGASVADAAAAARRTFGNSGTYAEASREAWGWQFVDTLGQDIRFATRRLAQRPAFAIAVITMLALGTGATTAMFSAVDAAVLRPLPFPHAEQLVWLPSVSVPSELGGHHDAGTVSLPMLAENKALFRDAAAYGNGGLNYGDPQHPQRIAVGVVTANFFHLLNIAPAIGRDFSAEEGKPGGPTTAVISWQFWQSQFGGGSAIGRIIRLNDRDYEIVGIMPAGFSFPAESDLWIAMSVPITIETFEPFHGFISDQVIARLAPGVTVPYAAAQMRSLWTSAYNRKRTPANSKNTDSRLANLALRPSAVPLQTLLAGKSGMALLVLLAATGILLLIACANVTNLLLAQSVSRRREIAVREVLGARRSRVIRQLLTESVMLSTAGVAIGVALAPLLLHLLSSLMPPSLTGLADARISLRVLGFAAALALTTGVAFGMWPAFGDSETQSGSVIRESAGARVTRGGKRVRLTLVGAEIALTAVLLMGAGLMLRSFQRLTSVDSGLVTDRSATAQIAFASSVHDVRDRVALILDRLRSTPGIAAAGAVDDLPLGGGGGTLMSVVADGMPAPAKDADPAHQIFATNGYFAAMGIPLIAGRTFTIAGDSAGPTEAIISAKAARTYWPGVSNPVGRTFRSDPADTAAITVIGVVGDVREFGLAREPMPAYYRSAQQAMAPTMSIVVRGSLPPAALLAAIDRAVHAIDPSQPVFKGRTVRDVVDSSMAPQRSITWLIAMFAGVALVIALVGVGAVVSQGVASRAREFGIRAALGATGNELVGLACSELFWVVSIGTIAGLAGAWATMKLAASLLFDIKPHDPATFVAVPIVLAVAALIATLIPAMRAAHTNPAEIMRAE